MKKIKSKEDAKIFIHQLVIKDFTYFYSSAVIGLSIDETGRRFSVTTLDTFKPTPLYMNFNQMTDYVFSHRKYINRQIERNSKTTRIN